MSLASPRPPLRPLRVLTSPPWLGALAVLALNDHVLKGSGLLPGLVTGKLSDFAGLFLAPALMAASLRVRGREALVACHVAVGAVFVALQLSAEFVTAWSAAMAALGFPWHVTRDVTDLLALPALWASWRWLTPRMRTDGTAVLVLARRSLEFGCVGVGLWASLATSPPPQPVPEIEYANFEASVHLNNASEHTLTVRLRELRPEVQVDCFELSKDPGRIPDAAFGDTLTWTMPPWTNIPAGEANESADCHAVLVDGEGLSPALLFWERGRPGVGWVQGQTREDETPRTGAVVIELDADGVHQGYRSVGIELVFDRETEPPEYGQGCEAQSDGDRLDWSSPVPTGLRRIEAVEVGPDGCVAVDLEASARWFVCLPPGLWGPPAGSWVDIRHETGITGALPGVWEAVHLELRADDGSPLVEDRIEMVLSRGTGAPDLRGLNLVLSERDACEVTVDEGCGTLGRNGVVQAWASTEHELAPGDAAVQIDVDAITSVELAVVHAEQRFVLDPECAEGSDAVGPDVELAAVIRETQ